MEAAVIREHENRRQSLRYRCVTEHRIRAARIRPGDGAIVIDASAAGILVETQRRLLPGTMVEVQMETDNARIAARGRVLRSAVVTVRASGIAYRGAVLFDRHLPWFAEPDDRGADSSERRDGGPVRVRATHTAL